MAEKYFQIQGTRTGSNWKYDFEIPSDSGYNADGKIIIPWKELDCFGNIDETLKEISTEKISGLVLKIIPTQVDLEKNNKKDK